MFTLVVCGTDRPEARTRTVARHIYNNIQHAGKEVRYFDLIDLPASFFEHKYSWKNMSAETIEIQDTLFIPATKIIWVVPEYNGSIAGICKWFIDAISVRKRVDTFRWKPVWLIGVADGRAGNLRGLDHLSAIMLHMGAIIFPGRVPLSKINDLLSEDKSAITDEATLALLQKKSEEFDAFTIHIK